MKEIIAAIEALVPLFIEVINAIKEHHPDKCSEEHLQIAHDLINQKIKENS